MLKFIHKHRIFLVFTLYSCVCWSWGWFVQVGRITEDKLVGYVGVAIGYLVVVLIAATIFTISFKYLRQKYKSDKPNIWLLRAIVVWAFAEFLAAWLAAAIWMGQEGSLDTTLPFSSLAPLLAHTPIVYISRFVGFYGLSAVITIGMAGIYFKKTRRSMIYYWLVIVIATTAAWKFYEKPNLPPVQATIVAETLDSRISVNPSGSELIVLPEYGLDEVTGHNINPRFNPTDNSEYYFVGSRQTSVRTGHTNELIFGSKSQGNTNVQPKTRLIPLGEYLPYGFEMGTWLLARSAYTDFQIRRAVIKGNKPIQTFRINKQLVVGAEVCSSMIAPHDYRQLVKQGATVLTNSASLEVFEGSRLYRWQDEGFAKFIAVANARPFLQSTNNWPAVALDHNGKQLVQIYPHNQAQVSVSPNSTRTIYSYLGEWVAAVGAGLAIFEVLRRWHQKRR